MHFNKNAQIEAGKRTSKRGAEGGFLVVFLLEATSIVRGHKWIEDPVFDRNTTAMQKNLKNFQRSLT